MKNNGRPSYATKASKLRTKRNVIVNPLCNRKLFQLESRPYPISMVVQLCILSANRPIRHSVEVEWKTAFLQNSIEKFDYIISVFAQLDNFNEDLLLF